MNVERGRSADSPNLPSPFGDAPKIAIACRELIAALQARSADENWTHNTLERLHKRLKSDEKSWPPEERLFALDGSLGRLNPSKIVAWGRLFGIGKDSSQIAKYLRDEHNFDSDWTLQDTHLNRMLSVVKALNLVSGIPRFTRQNRSEWLRSVCLIRDEVGRARSPGRGDTSAEEVATADQSAEAQEALNIVRPDTLVLYDPRVEGRVLRGTGRIIDSLFAKVARDTFRERDPDVEFLRRFVKDAGDIEPLRLFRWALVVGAGGQGKTRLAIEFFSEVEAQGFRVGFLPLARAKNFDARLWDPQQPTFVVIDYAAESPLTVARLLQEFVSAAAATLYRCPIRMLLLEREAVGHWFETILPKDSTGAVVRRFCWPESMRRLEHQLTPLSRDGLLKIMRGRLLDRHLPDELLVNTLFRIDPHIGADGLIAPRPLFAAAAAEAIVELTKENDDPTAVISKLEREDVLSWLIGRERAHFWTDHDASDRQLEERRLRLHENLLAVTTIALDLPRQIYVDDCPAAAREYLPSAEVFDHDRFRRMTGSNSVDMWRRFEPDILGEFFVLRHLTRLPARERQALVDAGLRLGEARAPLFVTRCATDFPDLWRECGFMAPSIRRPEATTAFALALVRLAEVLDDSRIDDVVAAWVRMEKLIGQPAAVSSEVDVAVVLVRLGAMLSGVDRWEAANRMFDNVVGRFGTITEPALREQTARALLGKALAFEKLDRRGEVIAVCDDIATRFGADTDPAVRELIAKALLKKSSVLGGLGRTDEAIAVCDEILRQFGEANEAPVREIVADALLKKGIVLSGLNRRIEALAVYDDMVVRFRMATDSAMVECVAKALFNKGVTLEELGQAAAAIAQYDNVINQFGAAAAPTLREVVANALLKKGITLQKLSRNNEAVALYAEIVERFETEPGFAVRNTVATALLNKGVALEGLGRGDEAIAASDDIVSRFVLSTEPALREWVAKALFNKGLMLERRDQSHEATLVYNDIVARFATATEPPLRELVALAVRRVEACSQRARPQ